MPDHEIAVGKTTDPHVLLTELAHAKAMTAQAMAELATARMLAAHLIERHDAEMAAKSEVIVAQRARMLELYAKNRVLEAHASVLQSKLDDRCNEIAAMKKATDRPPKDVDDWAMPWSTPRGI